ncbi:MAG: hypothetical protein EBW19_08570, partial [Betaproteobacteria bacterium]|nr:hypothetical protein [Betaproteobacteria bacterium]
AYMPGDRLRGQDRVAGHDCQVIALAPKDNLRFGHKYCAERVTGLALGAGNSAAALASNYSALSTAGSSVDVTAASLTLSGRESRLRLSLSNCLKRRLSLGEISMICSITSSVWSMDSVWAGVISRL